MRLKDLEALVRSSAGVSLVIEPLEKDKHLFVDTKGILDADGVLSENVTLAHLSALIESALDNEAKVSWVHDGVRVRPEYSLADLHEGKSRHVNRSGYRLRHQIDIFSRACQLIDSYESIDRAHRLLVTSLKKVRDFEDVQMIEMSIQENTDWYNSLNESQRNEISDLMIVAKSRVVRKKSP